MPNVVKFIKTYYKGMNFECKNLALYWASKLFYARLFAMENYETIFSVLFCYSNGKPSLFAHKAD